MKASLERRLERLRDRWNSLVCEHDAREAQRWLRAGCDPGKPWEEWPAPLLALLAEMGRDPAELHASLAVVKAREAGPILEVVYLEPGQLSSMARPPLVVLYPGMREKLLPDATGDQDAPTPAQGASMPVTAPERHPELGQPTAQPQESWEVRKERYQREMQEQQRRERRSGHSLAAIHRRQREEQQKRR